MMPDIPAALVTYLKNDADVADQVGARVYAGELPSDLPLTNNLPPKCVLIQAAGGGGPFARTFVPIGTPRYDVRCYAPTLRDAWAVYGAVFPALKTMRRNITGGALLFEATPITEGTMLREPDTLWPFVFASFAVMAAEEAVAS